MQISQEKLHIRNQGEVVKGNYNTNAFPAFALDRKHLYK